MGRRICIIGAGPCGMATLFHFSKLKQIPDVVCFEKQETWGGLWNFSWRTGIDDHGEPCPNGMYKYLWSNSIKEVMEFPDYTFETHFGKTTPSFMPRSVMRHYLEGHWTKGSCTDLKKYIKFNTAVRYVKFDDDANEFIVTVADYNTGKTREEIFSHLGDEPKSEEEMESDAKAWHTRSDAIRSETDAAEVQSALVSHLADIGGYTKDIMKTLPTFYEWIQRRREKGKGLAKYRDSCYANIYSGKMAPKQTPFMENFDDSVRGVLKVWCILI